MKKNLITILMILTLMLNGCSQVTETSKTNDYIIPTEYFEFLNAEPEDAIEAYSELGEEYCTEIVETEDGVMLKLTDEQRDNMIQRNNDMIDEQLDEFTDNNALYSYEADENYEKLILSFDENLSVTDQIATVFGVPSIYGMNYMLQNNTTEWVVDVTILNCHTGKEVISMKVPVDKVSYGPAEWEESYSE